VVRARYAAPAPGTLLVTPAVRDTPPTPYARFGDAPLWVMIGLSAVASAWRARRPH
jgi:apolipoprotein N-acyltransferase